MKWLSEGEFQLKNGLVLVWSKDLTIGHTDIYRFTLSCKEFEPNSRTLGNITCLNDLINTNNNNCMVKANVNTTIDVSNY